MIPRGYAAAQVARSQDETQEQVDQTVAAKKEAFVSRYVDRANGEQEWETLLARRGVGR